MSAIEQPALTALTAFDCLACRIVLSKLGIHRPYQQVTCIPHAWSCLSRSCSLAPGCADNDKLILYPILHFADH